MDVWIAILSNISLLLRHVTTLPKLLRNPHLDNYKILSFKVHQYSHGLEKNVTVYISAKACSLIIK